LDPGIEDVLLAPQDLAEITVDLRALPERTDVAPGAQAAFAGALQQDDADGGIGFKAIESLLDVAKHLQRPRIDGLGPVEPDHTGRTFDARNQIAFFHNHCRHRAPSINLRATMSRMISLVPSRI